MAVLQANLVAAEFVGRRAELQALEGLLDGVLAGRGAFALVAGDAGIGKTRLCRELKASAARRGVRVIEGRSSPGETSAPYGPFMDALRFRISRGESAVAANVLAPVLAHVAPLFAVFSAEQPPSVPAATAVPFEPICHVLQRLASVGPTLLVLEDVHWADVTSHDLLLYLARRMSGLPLLLLATYRTDDLAPGHNMQRLAATLAREPAGVRIQLDPLTSDEVAAMLASLLGAAPDPELVAAVQRRAEGNPFYVEELVGVLLGTAEAGTDLTADSVARLPAPTTLQEVVWERLRALDDDAREALLVAAVAGRRSRFDVLARALDWPEERLLPVVESLVAGRLLLESGGAPDEYEFRHSLVQEVLYATVIGRRRRVWHRRVAAAIEALAAGGPLPHSTLAHHCREAGDVLRAREHAIRAADEAARLCAWKDAEALYESALAAVEHTDGDVELQAYILERMSQVAWWQNRLAALDQYLDEALALRRSLGDRHGSARLLHRRALLDADQRGAEARAVAALEEALALVDETAPERALIANDLGRLRMRSGDFEAASALCEEALRVSGCSGGCGEDAFALAMLGQLAVQRGEIRAGTERLELARSLLAQEPHEPERTAAVLQAGIRAFDACRDHRRAREWIDAALTHAVRHHAVADAAICHAYEAAVLRRAGDWVQAREVAQHAVGELRAAGRAELREALRVLGDIERVRGNLDAAAATYREAVRLGDADAAVGQALLRAAEQSWQEAARELERQLDERPAADRLFRLRVLPILAEACAEAGDADAAERAVIRLRNGLDGCDYPPGAAVLAEAEARLLVARGRTDDALAELRRARDAWRGMELPYETARTTLQLAERLLEAGRAEEGIETVREAARTFDALGARLDLARADSLLRATGVRVPRRRRDRRHLQLPLGRLTPRELDVLTELARGSTNKRIARTLSMSPRTVGNHVSAILAKLGCATRTEASRIALEARLEAAADGGLQAAGAARTTVAI